MESNMGLVHKIFGTHSQHELKRIAPIADKVESYREEYGKLTDEQLKAKTKEFKERLAKGETLDDILPEAYATVREAGKRVLGMEHYRVQIIGGIILHQGRIAEMRTGEGKTLVCTLPAYLNALEEKGVLVVTVNDYLAKRDAEWMGQIHNFLHAALGQHGAADYAGVIAMTRPAHEKEYRNPLSELRAIGYDDLHIMRRARPKFINS